MAPSLQEAKIAFIGGGNMAAAMIGGLVTSGIHKKNISVAEPWEENRRKMQANGVNTTTSNAEASQNADVVILAVKPQVVGGVCEELGKSWADKAPLVVSIVAGITLDGLTKSFKAGGSSPHIVRVMPNTPALVGEGASGLYADPDVTDGEKSLVTALLASVSKSIEWVDREQLLDVVTGLSGSGPAYFFVFVEHLITSAVNLGLPLEQATRLAKQTCLGAGQMLTGSSVEPSQLRKNVTSPNGTTHAALQSFEASNLGEIVDKAVKAAAHRSEELGQTSS